MAVEPKAYAQKLGARRTFGAVWEAIVLGALRQPSGNAATVMTLVNRTGFFSSVLGKVKLVGMDPMRPEV